MALTKITSTNIGANAVTSSALSNTALTTALGYTPANKAGDTFTNNINIGYDGYPAIKFKNAAGTDKAEMYVGTSAGDLNIVVAGGAAIAIDSSARARMLYQPSCQLSRSSSFTSTGSVILWNQISHNVGSHYNASTGIFTAPVAGKYLVGLMVMSAGTAATMDINVRINGNSNDNRLVPYQSSAGASYNQVSGSSIFNLAANDTVDVYLGNGSVYGDTGGRHCSFYIHFLG